MMNKLFRKKLTRGGFTLAELLIVVAIIAILVAIAFPIFSNALKDAQLRVNQANIRDVKAAATTDILMNWNKKANNAGVQKLMSAGVDTGWFAQADVSKNGDISNLKIYVANAVIADDQVATYCGVSVNALNANPTTIQASDGVSGNLTKDGKLETVGIGESYHVQVYMKDIPYTPGT